VTHPADALAALLLWGVQNQRKSIVLDRDDPQRVVCWPEVLAQGFDAATLAHLRARAVRTGPDGTPAFLLGELQLLIDELKHNP
jgi:hypothetical protein